MTSDFTEYGECAVSDVESEENDVESEENDVVSEEDDEQVGLSIASKYSKVLIAMCINTSLNQ